VPDRDIEIRYVGLRPGEKLDEELIARGERSLPTAHPKIRELRGPHVISSEIPEWIDRLKLAIEKRDEAGAIAHMAVLAPEYDPARSGEGLRRTRSAAAPTAAG
jgi:FlaA1/EpsC-like NDP-sugar epimerase